MVQSKRRSGLAGTAAQHQEHLEELARRADDSLLLIERWTGGSHPNDCALATKQLRHLSRLIGEAYAHKTTLKRPSQRVQTLWERISGAFFRAEEHVGFACEVGRRQK